jgi:hypothetical protein
LISTVSSETWIAGAGSCLANGQSCFLTHRDEAYGKGKRGEFLVQFGGAFWERVRDAVSAQVHNAAVRHASNLPGSPLEHHQRASKSLFLINSTDTLCTTNKGGLFNPLKSSSWQEQGFFDLGVDYQLGNTAYAEYGLDNLTFGTSGITIPSAIIGAFNGSGTTNTTSYFNGLFGLGITPGNFTNVTPLSAISALVEQMGTIPSHSYGYTAGANYRTLINSFNRYSADYHRTKRGSQFLDAWWI